MSLPDWENGWLQRHKTSPNEIRDLLGVVERDLADSATEGLSADWRMNIAYNAALQAAPVALAATGYRVSRDQHHYRVIQSLRETLGTDAQTVNAFDVFGRNEMLPGTIRPGSLQTPMRRRCARRPSASKRTSSGGSRHITPRC
jgi:hypothetical protein